jgi:hypothetical protein
LEDRVSDGGGCLRVLGIPIGLIAAIWLIATLL